MLIMSRVLVWKSDADGKLFEDKSKYQKHLRKLAAERRKIANIEVAKEQREEFIVQMRSVQDIKGLEQFIKDNWKWFFYNGLAHEFSTKKQSKMHELVDIEFKHIRWNPHLSNSHSHPIGGVMNWGERDPKVPSGYPGWCGELCFSIKTPPYLYRGKTYYDAGFGSRYFERTIIHTGTGGARGHDMYDDSVSKYGYSCTLWAADFPGLVRTREKELVWDELSRK